MDVHIDADVPVAIVSYVAAVICLRVCLFGCLVHVLVLYLFGLWLCVCE